MGALTITGLDLETANLQSRKMWGLNEGNPYKAELSPAFFPLDEIKNQGLFDISRGMRLRGVRLYKAKGRYGVTLSLSADRTIRSDRKRARTQGRSARQASPRLGKLMF